MPCGRRRTPSDRRGRGSGAMRSCQEEGTSVVAGSSSSTTFRTASERSVVQERLNNGPVPSVRSRLAAATPRAGTGRCVDRASSMACTSVPAPMILSRQIGTARRGVRGGPAACANRCRQSSGHRRTHRKRHQPLGPGRRQPAGFGGNPFGQPAVEVGARTGGPAVGSTSDWPGVRIPRRSRRLTTEGRATRTGGRRPSPWCSLA